MKSFVVCFLFVVFLADAGSAKSNAASDSVLVTVNGTRVTQSQVDAMIASELQMGMSMGQIPANVLQHNLRIRAMDEIIQRVVIEERVEVKGIKFSEKQLNDKMEMIAGARGMTLDEFIFKVLPTNNMTFAEYRGRVLMGMKFDKLIEVEAGGNAFAVGEKEARRHYKRNLKEFDRPAMARASHIMIKYSALDKESKAEVIEAMDQIRKMASMGADFGMLARKYSEDESTRAIGGDLGVFTKKNMMAEIAEAAFALKAGQMSGIIELPYGCHLIKVVEVDQGGVASFDEVKNGIMEWIKNDKKKVYSARYVESLLSKARIQWPGGKRPEPIRVQEKN